MNGFTAHQPPKAGLDFLHLAFGLPCEIFLQISQGEFVFWCLLFGACYTVLKKVFKQLVVCNIGKGNF